MSQGRCVALDLLDVPSTASTADANMSESITITTGRDYIRPHLPQDQLVGRH